MVINFQEQVSQKNYEELLEIFMNSDDFQESFVQAVFEELQKRNISLTNIERQKEEKQKAKDEAMEKGKAGDPFYIILGFISAILGGIPGIVAGYIYSQSKHNDNPRGDYYIYDEPTRTKGYAMLVIGLIIFFALLINTLV